MPQSQPPPNGGTSRLPDGWENWPTAIEVSKRLGIARAHVYRMHKAGELRGVEGSKLGGKKTLRFDPESVEALAPASEQSELAALAELGADDDESGEGGAKPPDLYRLLARVLSESRQISIDARKGQHEAYTRAHEAFGLMAKPTQEITSLMGEALKQAYSRIHELEERLNSMHDEQRDARREDREFALFEKTVTDGEVRKEQFAKLFLENAPVLFGQLAETMRSRGGPVAEWFSSKTPEQQKKVIAAIETFLSVADEANEASSSASSENGVAAHA